MRIALFADIHANAGALRACLEHARGRGATHHAFLGDLVGYGPDPGEVIDLVAGHAANGAIVVKGNHDAAVEGEGGYLNESAAAAIDWTRGALTPGERDFLVKLPLCVHRFDCCFVHASADAPERFRYIDGPGAAMRSMDASESPRTYAGHVHDQVLYVSRADRALAFKPQTGIPVPTPAHRASLALVGSVGQPRDGNPAAAYALVDLEDPAITFHRIAYDHHETARRIRAAGLPEILAYRIERGA
jgi:diadenosine tetraphosphatase ApaH/serine/threonine PP2A family protein phosphatase